MAIQIRRGTNTEWESNNSNIVVGEPAIATDEKRFFVGTASGDYAEFANLDIIAPAYDTTTSYVVGDIINYHGKLYSCNAPCSGAFNIGYWNETSLTEILKNLENEITYAQYEIGYASGELITVDNGASEIPVKDLTLDIKAVQSGSGDPSPTNVRPISGWDEVNVTVSGLNQLDDSMFTDGYLINNDGSISSHGSYRMTFGYIGVSPNSTYTLLCNKVSDGNYALRAGLYDENKQFISRVGNLISGTGLKTVSFTTTGDTAYVRVMSPRPTAAIDLQMSKGTVTEYSPFIGTTYTIDLDGTRYGGSLDVTTGVLTITHEYIDLGTYGINGTAVSSNVRRWYTTENPVFKKVTLCNSLKTSDSYVYKSLDYASISTDKRIAVTPTWGQSITTVADFNTAIANNPISVVIELATPQVVQLTPTQVRTVLGTNNLWNQMNSNNELAYRISNALN